MAKKFLPHIKPIIFSEKFMQKAGMEVFSKEYRKNFLTSLWLYAIDSDTRKLVNLSSWIREQRDESKAVLESIAQALKSKTTDEKIIEILRLVHKNIKYTRDETRYKKSELWQTATKTWELKTGDCEDGAILILTLAHYAGIQAHQIQLTCGLVKIDAKEEGHAWITYLAEFDGIPRYLDWCYWPDLNPIKKQLYFTDKTNYLDPWFMVNDQRYYGRYRNS